MNILKRVGIVLAIGLLLVGLGTTIFASGQQPPVCIGIQADAPILPLAEYERQTNECILHILMIVNQRSYVYTNSSNPNVSHSTTSGSNSSSSSGNGNGNGKGNGNGNGRGSLGSVINKVLP